MAFDKENIRHCIIFAFQMKKEHRRNDLLYLESG